MNASLSVCVMLSLVAGGIAQVRPATRTDANRTCPFNIIGIWESGGTTEADPVVHSFSADGWVTLLTPVEGARPQDFEMLGQVQYRLDRPTAPEHLEFTATHRNDLFPKGKTRMQIPVYSEDSFVTVNPESGKRAEWFRVKTSRRFLSFVAHTGPNRNGGPAFAMLTTMDGREPVFRALGIQPPKGDAGNAALIFGSISADLHQLVATEEADERQNKQERKKEENRIVAARFELTPIEFEKIEKVFDEWIRNANNRKLPHADAFLNGIEFFSRVADGLSACGDKADLRVPGRIELDEIASKHPSSLRMLEYVRVIKKQNHKLHVGDSAFPWGWQPALQRQAR